MNSADFVDRLIDQLKTDSIPLSDAVWETACACVGWPYVFGAEGQKTTKDGIQVRKFDCQGFTEWCLSQFGINIKAAGATSQWNNDKLWMAKGSINDIPNDVLVCLFYRDKKNPNKMAHTGFGFKGQTCECSVGVQHFEKRKSKWQYWAIPKGITDKVPKPEPAPDPQPSRPTIRRGSRGDAVRELQESLLALGYDIGLSGVDGIFGQATERAVKSLQCATGLVIDGIVGPRTWAEIDRQLPQENKVYKVTITGVSKEQACELLKAYPLANVEEMV